MLSARQRTAPGPTGGCGRDRGTTRHACAAPLRLGSIRGRGVRRPRTGTDPVDPCRTRPDGPLRGVSAAVVNMTSQTTLVFRTLWRGDTDAAVGASRGDRRNLNP